MSKRLNKYQLILIIENNIYLNILIFLLQSILYKLFVIKIILLKIVFYNVNYDLRITLRFSVLKIKCN